MAKCINSSWSPCSTITCDCGCECLCTCSKSKESKNLKKYPEDHIRSTEQYHVPVWNSAPETKIAGGGTGRPNLSNMYNELEGRTGWCGPHKPTKIDLSGKTSRPKVDILDPATSKKDKEIVDSDALHPDFVELLAKVAEVSMEKGYEPFNWLKPESPVRVNTLLKAAARHQRLAKKGVDNNVEKRLDGSEINIKVNHLVFAAYNNLMAAVIIRDLPEHDDRLFKDGDIK